MDEKTKEQLVDAFVFATRPPLSQQHRSIGWRRTSSWSFALEGSHNQVHLNMPAAPPPPEDAQLRRRLVAQALAHARRIEAMDLLRSWMQRTYGSPLLSQLTLPELRQAHREILTWRSAAG